MGIIIGIIAILLGILFLWCAKGTTIPKKDEEAIEKAKKEKKSNNRLGLCFVLGGVVCFLTQAQIFHIIPSVILIFGLFMFFTVTEDVKLDKTGKTVGIVCVVVAVLINIAIVSGDSNNTDYGKCSICHREMKCYICGESGLYCGQAEGEYGHYCGEHCHFIWD